MNKREIAAKEELQPILSPYVRQAYAPQISKEKHKNTIRTSKYFGNPYLEKDESWPEILGKPSVFVLQLDIATLPESVKPLLGNTGLLQFFYQEDPYLFEEDLSLMSLVRIVQPTDGNENTAQPETNYGIKKQKVIDGWSEVSDTPRYEEYPLLGLEELTEAIGEKYDVDIADLDVEPYQGDKLSGWPFWSQGVEYPKGSQGEEMIYVYQIDAGCFFDGKKLKAHAKELFAGSGTGHIFVSKNNPKELKFWWAC